MAPALNARVRVHGLVSIVFALYSAAMSAFLGLASLGLGAAFAFNPDLPTGFGAAFGAFGVAASLAGIGLSAFGGVVAVWILRGRKLGLFFGLGLAVLAVASGFEGNWTTLGWGVFGLWALWTSRKQFT